MTTALAVVSPNESTGHEALRNAVNSLVIDGLSSPHTQRSYGQALEEFLIWLKAESTRSFSKATVQKYRSELQAKSLSASSINVRLAAIRRLAAEASDNGLLAPEIAAAITRVKSVKHAGVRIGRWLTRDQAEQLLRQPNPGSVKGARDCAILAVLLGAGLRRSEVAALTFDHIQRREERCVIADLIGKQGRIRTVPIPDWVEAAIGRWAGMAGVSHGRVFRSVTKSGRIRSQMLSAQAIFAILKAYAAGIGISVAPHDMRRTYAHLAHRGQAPVEQIQFSLGHASIVTTQIYLGLRQDLRDAPCDRLGLVPPG